jgi:DNA (cytosine-5)-methyltransferase 1
MKILNLYAGIGGNRKLWQDVEVTAIELNPQIAKIYQDFFPNDKIIVDDAHQYLLDHFKEFDFIWSSPPCPSHSRLRKGLSCTVGGAKPIYPDMKLYEEILLLKHYFNGKWCVENVMSYYEPLIKPHEIQRHYFWSNFNIMQRNFSKDGINLSGAEGYGVESTEEQINRLQEKLGMNLDVYKLDKRTALRNCVNPHLGLHILNESKRNIQPELFR